MSEWIKHDGGEMPVKGDTLVEVDIVSTTIKGYANTFWWRHGNSLGDIIEYRILEPQQTTLDYQIEVMQAYRDGAKIECKYSQSDIWRKTAMPTWSWSDTDYRIKQEPKTHTMPDGTELPLPVGEPLEDGEEYWLVDTASDRLISSDTWASCRSDQRWLERGLIYKTEQEAQQVADYIINKVLKVEK